MKIKIILLIMLMFIVTTTNITFASANIMTSTEEALDISSFIVEAGKYTEEVFKDIDFSETLDEAIKGKIDTSGIGKEILDILGIEIKEQITMISSIIIIIIIHSILKTFSDGLENSRN